MSINSNGEISQTFHGRNKSLQKYNTSLQLLNCINKVYLKMQTTDGEGKLQV